MKGGSRSFQHRVKGEREERMLKRKIIFVTLTIVIHKFRNLIGTLGIAEFGPK